MLYVFCDKLEENVGEAVEQCDELCDEVETVSYLYILVTG